MLTMGKRYEEKLRDQAASPYQRCHARCWASKRDPRERNSPSVLQPHGREIDGRVFVCRFCAFASSLDCERPEHDGETCAAYQARVALATHHAEAEAASAAAFARCPQCACFWEWHPKGNKGCNYTVCENCKFRFCAGCLIPWVGDGSAYLGGKEAHGEGCKYRDRDAESKHTLKNRFEPPPEVKARLEEASVGKEEKKKERVEKKRKAEADSNEAFDEMVVGHGAESGRGKRVKIGGSLIGEDVDSEGRV